MMNARPVRTRPVRTRFAPSPTGALHIGGARTALFAQMLARRFEGQFLIRVEDTDKERSTSENIAQIETSLSWLGLDADEPTIFQSKNLPAHHEAVQKLLNEGYAYEDEGAIRFKMPSGDFTLHDAVQGTVTFPADSPNLQDWVVQRSDGTPTYNLAVTVDDHDMRISHVLRGDDHLNNTPKQIALWNALYPQEPLPIYAHTPMIHGDDGKKMSKRHGAVSVMSYQEMGFLPEALANYLLLLGWQGVPEQEIFDRTKAAQHFDLDQLSKAPSTFDQKKLAHVSQQHLMQLDGETLFVAVKSYLPTLPNDIQKKWLVNGLVDLAQRANNLVELAAQTDFYLSDAPFELDEKGQQIMTNAAPRLTVVAAALSQLTTWDVATLKQAFQDILATQGWAFKELGQPCRLALMGRLNGPDLAAVMVVLGREEALKRLSD